VHQPPSAADLLRTVADTLTEEIVPALDGPAQHRARVAASIVEIVAREIDLGPAVRAAEAVNLRAIAGDADADPAAVAVALRAGAADDPAEHARVRDLLIGIARGDLSIAKPGYDDWDGD
jgi:hypothetical protein